jgi:hypothetical protein
MKIDISKLVFDGCWESALLDEVTVYFIAPKELVEYRFGDGAKIMVTYSKHDPYNCCPEFMISPTQDGVAYDWDFLDLDNDEDTTKALLKAALEKMEDHDG